VSATTRSLLKLDQAYIAVGLGLSASLRLETRGSRRVHTPLSKENDLMRIERFETGISNARAATVVLSCKPRRPQASIQIWTIQALYTVVSLADLS